MHILIPALHRPSKPTGVCRHAANLAQCLVEMDSVRRVTLVVGEWQTEYFEQSFSLNSPKIDIVSVCIKNTSLARNRWFMFGLPKLASNLQPDIIHMSFPFPFVRKWFQAPIVSTIHDLYPYECPENFGYPRVWFNRWFLRQCVGQSNALVCVSKATLNSLDHYFPGIGDRKKTTVAYNYVDFSGINPIPPSQMPSKKNFGFIFCVAQHRKNKNLDLLIHAYHELQELHALDPEAKLVIVGSPGPETENIIKQIKELNLQENVLLLSAIGDGELCWLYKNCSVFAIPSSTEGFCIPLVEALTLSPRVVCSDIPIFEEVGSSDCTYFQLDNNPADNLRKALEFSLSQPEIKHDLPSARFSKSSLAHQLVNFYTSVQ